MGAYYNEIDPYAVQWLRNLISEGHIAPGDVDERDIRDVRPSDLLGYTQCHFFAGIGVWSYALRRAGWPDDRPVWTGSCPCQPFSAAGAGAGFDDERHLWPHFNHLIAVVRPPIVAGEQVASKDADPWIDLVQADLEAMGYAFGCVPFPAAGVGAPHIRDRNYWVADLDGEQWHGSGESGSRGRSESPDRRTVIGLDHHHHQGPQGHAGNGDSGGRRSGEARPASEAGVPGRVSDSDGRQCDGFADGEGREPHRASAGRQQSDGFAECCGAVGRVSDSTSSGRREECADRRGCGSGDRAEGQPTGHSSSSSIGRLVGVDQPEQGRGRRITTVPGIRQDWYSDQGTSTACGRPGPTNGIWRNADWLLCRDGKWRPVEPGTFPLAHGVTSRVGRLRAYGNAIVSEAAEAFIASYLEHERAALVCNGGMIGHNGGPPLDDFDELLLA